MTPTDVVRLALWLGGAASGRWTFLLAGDLAVAGVFAWWPATDRPRAG